MLDVKFIRENLALVKKSTKEKGYTVDFEKLLRLDDKRRMELSKVELLRQRRNEIAAEMKGKKPTEDMIIEGRAVKEELATAEARMAEAEGKIKGADCFSPHNQEPTHPEYGFYGIHGIETLYTVMGGKGCVAVSRMATHKDHVVVGEWEDGRIGTFRAFLDGTQLYGGTVYTDRNKALAAGGYIGYKDLLKEILQFFSTGVEPISREESLEIFAFMRAANLSGERGGARVTIEEAFRSAEKEAKKLLKQYK